MRKLTFEDKQHLKSMLLEAATDGVRSMLRSSTGVEAFGSVIHVYPYDKLTEVDVPGEPRRTYFEIIVKERRK